VPRLLRLLLALLLAAPVAPAAENKYDVLAKVLLPFAGLLAERSVTGQRAVQLTARLEAMTDLPPALLGARAELALEYPDKLRLRAPVLGEMLTIARDGQRLWVAPGARAAALLEAASAGKKLPPADPKARLAPFRLPIPEKQLVFLPALFRVADGGEESVDGATCRVLSLELAPEVARSMEAKGWSASVWVREKGAPARLVLRRADWEITVRFERVEFSKSLPASTWQPAPEESSDVLKLTPAQYFRLLGAFGG
jgi:hypothetical protein